MGSTKSKLKTSSSNVEDFNKLKIPDTHILIKISTYCVNVGNSVGLKHKIKEIISYIDTKIKNKKIDILCLQGIKDKVSANTLVRSIKKHAKNNNMTIYFAPDFDDISATDNTYLSIEHSTSGKSSVLSTDDDKDNNIPHNIIISRFPIDRYMVGDINILAADIKIHENNIRIIVTELTADVKLISMSNSTVRKNELVNIFNFVQKLQEDKKETIKFLVGSLNISETIDGDINKEFLYLIQNWHCVDIYRYLNLNLNGKDDDGYTNNINKRYEYIMFLLDGAIIGNSNIKTADDLFKYIFKTHKVYFIDSSIAKDAVDDTDAVNYPVECVFMMPKNI
jgi:hypothetical protein